MLASLLDASAKGKPDAKRPGRASFGQTKQPIVRIVRRTSERNPTADRQHKTKLRELIQHCGGVGNLAFLLSLPVGRILRACKPFPSPCTVACIAIAHQFIIGDGSAPLLDLDWIVENRLRGLRDEWRMKRWVTLENKDGDGI